MRLSPSFLLVAAAGLLLPCISAAGPPHPDFKPHPRDQACTKILTRKEWRTLSVDERKDFIVQLRKLYTPAGGERDSWMDKITKMHVELSMLVHGNVAFFPWHRWLIRYVELKLQQVSGNAELTMPYWSTTFDAEAPELAPVFGDADHEFGSNGNKDKGGCVDTGPFKNLQVQYSGNGALVTKGHCLTRTFSPMALVPTDVVMGTIRAKQSFAQFYQFVEVVPHSRPHMFLGGDSIGMPSSNDPLFWLYHADIDRMWDVWQTMDKEKRLKEYNGNGMGPDRRPRKVSLEDPLHDYEHIKVADVMDLASLCVRYQELDMPKTGDQPVPKLQRRADVPVQVSVVEAKPEEPVTPPTNDRTDLTAIRYSPPVSAEWIKINNLNETAVREAEAETSKAIDALNRIPGYVSVSALWNHPAKLAKLPSWTNLKVRLGKMRAVVALKPPGTFDLKHAVESLKQSVRKALQTDHVVQNYKPQVQEQVQKATGGKWDIVGWFTGLKQRLTGSRTPQDSAKVQ